MREAVELPLTYP